MWLSVTQLDNVLMEIRVKKGALQEAVVLIMYNVMKKGANEGRVQKANLKAKSKDCQRDCAS